MGRHLQSWAMELNAANFGIPHNKSMPHRTTYANTCGTPHAYSNDMDHHAAR